MTPRAAPVVTNPLSPGGPAPAPMTPRDAMEQTFTSFTRKHRASLNALIRANPGLIGGSFSILIKTASVLDFDSPSGASDPVPDRAQTSAATSTSSCTGASRTARTTVRCTSTSVGSTSSKTRSRTCVR